MATPKQAAEGVIDLPRSRSPLPSNELQQLWFATLRQPWSSLVVVPAHPGGSGLAVAKALAEIGSLHRNSPIKLLSAEAMDMNSASRLILEVTHHVVGGGLVIIAIDSVISNPTGIPLALAADAALLCVTLGDTDFNSARRTLDMIGPSRFVGSVTLDRGSLG